MHAACFGTWAVEVRKRPVAGRAAVTCPYCRSDWVDALAPKGRVAGSQRDTVEESVVVEDDGYVNVARELGISGIRGKHCIPYAGAPKSSAEWGTDRTAWRRHEYLLAMVRIPPEASRLLR
jgi:hypothetical protein